MNSLIKTLTRKERRRFIQSGGNAADVSRLLEDSNGQPIGHVVQLEYGPLVVGTPLEYFTSDDGGNFVHVHWKGEILNGGEMVIGSPETDPKIVTTLRLLLTEWKRKLEQAP
jgi:hypothetical protein